MNIQCHHYLGYLIVVRLMMMQCILNEQYTLSGPCESASVSNNSHLSTQDMDHKIIPPVDYNAKKCVASWGLYGH